MDNLKKREWSAQDPAKPQRTVVAGGLSLGASSDHGEEKKLLDTFLYGNVLLAHGTSGDNLGCV